MTNPVSSAESPPVLDAGWREWLAHNHLRGCTAESMAAQMAASGWPRKAADAAVREALADPVLRAASRHAAALDARVAKLASVLGNLQAVWEAAPSYAEIGRRSSAMGRDAFFREHYLAQRPVVLTDLCRDWPAMQRWQPSVLARRFGDCEVEIQAGRDGDANYEINSPALRRRVRFGDFIDRIVTAGPSNDCYLTANNHVFRHAGFASLHNDIGDLPAYVDRSQLAGSGHWWVGPRGTSTPLHHDKVMLIHAQVVGAKRWRLISPLQTPRVYNHRGVFSEVDLDRIDFERFPLMRGVRILDVVVAPGEALFLPLGWWHQVDALDVSVSLSFSNIDFPNRFDYADPARVWP